MNLSRPSVESSTKLNGSNYIAWKNTVKLELASAGLLQQLESKSVPKDVVLQEKAWAVVLKSIEHILLPSFIHFNSARSILEEAKNLYGSVDSVKFHKTLRAIDSVRFDGVDLESHLAIVRSMIAELGEYTTETITEAQTIDLLMATFDKSSNHWNSVFIKVIAGEIHTAAALESQIRAHHLAFKEKPLISQPALAATPAKFPLTTITKDELPAYVKKLIGDGIVVCNKFFRVGHLTEGHRDPIRSPYNSSKVPGVTETASAKPAKAATATMTPVSDLTTALSGLLG